MGAGLAAVRMRGEESMPRAVAASLGSVVSPVRRAECSAARAAGCLLTETAIQADPAAWRTVPPVRLRRAIDTAHTAAIPVTYVTVRFRQGHPEVSPRNKSFAAITRHGGFADTDPATEIHPDVTPQPGDVIVTKRRVSAFSGSDLPPSRCRHRRRVGRPTTHGAHWQAMAHAQSDVEAAVP
jgi:hypothetical protein